MKKILIIGGAGFIGINAARYFLKKGSQVTIFDNFSRRGTEIKGAERIDLEVFARIHH